MTKRTDIYMTWSHRDPSWARRRVRSIAAATVTVALLGIGVVTGPVAHAAPAPVGQGFTVTRVDIQSDQAQGVVVAEDPPSGTSVPKGSKITLSVSKGPATTQIPDVTNQTQADATTLLQGAGLTVAVTYEDVTDPSQDGLVISQDIVADYGGRIEVASGRDGTRFTVHLAKAQWWITTPHRSS